jgi:NhaP-type Na+/H+ or K+/H+ antiporter
MFAAMIWSRLLEKIRGLQNSIFTTPAFLFVIYGISEYLGFSGAISALAFGVVLNNITSFKGFLADKIIGVERHSLNQTEIVFVQEISFLLKTFFFVYVGLSMVFDNWLHILFGLGITVVIFTIRMPIAKFCSPLSATPTDKSFIALMVPKGLAAAVMAAIPAQMGLPGGEIIKNVVFTVVFVSILFTSILMILLKNFPKVQQFFAKIYR